MKKTDIKNTDKKNTDRFRSPQCRKTARTTAAFLSAVLLFALLLSLTACGKSTDSVSASAAEQSSTRQTASVTEQGSAQRISDAASPAPEKTSSGSAAEETLEKYNGTIYDCFDTITTVTAYCDSEAVFSELMERIETEFTRYHQLYDIYNSYEGMTNLHDVNMVAADSPVHVPEEVTDIILFGKEMYELTDCNVNIAFGAVLKLWHEAREFSLANPDQAYIPDMDKLREAAEHCDMNKITVDQTAGTVRFMDPEMSLDVGAVAKGYSVERIAQGLIADGYDHVLINAGGNVRAIGSKPGGKDWVVGITNPDTSSSVPYVQTVSVNNKAVVTSGDYQRYYTLDGVRYHHIINRDTLMPADFFRSVTIVAEDSGKADALSTAVFNMDQDTGKSFVDSLENVEGIWIE